MKPRNSLLQITVSALFALAVLAMAGCASTPEKRITNEQPKLTKEQRKIAEKERKVAENQKHLQQTLASYSDEQLRFKLASLEQAIERGRIGMNILLQQGNGIGVLIAQGQIEEKVKERDAVGLELARRGGDFAGPAPRVVPDDGNQGQIKGFGSGFFITENGCFVTCAHVEKNAAKITVHTKNGTFPAKLLREDRVNDVAVLKVEGSFPALPLVNSGASRLGETVFTIGFPNPQLQGFAPKFTRGEISGLSGVEDDPTKFQISVPVQPGNSGGPLVNQRGAVIGMVASKLSERVAFNTSGSLPENVNYAVKASYVLPLLESLPEVAGKVREPFAGQERKQEDVIKEVEDAIALVICY
jgi:S1-C subfamily serine protease